MIGVRRKMISLEGLKLIAYGTMLIDHIGAVFVPWIGLRVIGRIAFPIFCFLLCEGVAHTSDPRRYALRLAIGAVISEIPFDLLFFGGIDPGSSSVMVTLLLGMPAVWCIRKSVRPWVQTVVIVLAVMLAELLGSDYGGMGVLMILIFAFPMHWGVRLGLLTLLCWCLGGGLLSVLGVAVPVQAFAVLALVPIGMYSGQKRWRARVWKWVWYLFYPVHLLVLWGLLRMT